VLNSDNERTVVPLTVACWLVQDNQQRGVCITFGGVSPLISPVKSSHSCISCLDNEVELNGIETDTSFSFVDWRKAFVFVSSTDNLLNSFYFYALSITFLDASCLNSFYFYALSITFLDASCFLCQLNTTNSRLHFFINFHVGEWGWKKEKNHGSMNLKQEFPIHHWFIVIAVRYSHWLPFVLIKQHVFVSIRYTKSRDESV
jgi:hypothetical protein